MKIRNLTPHAINIIAEDGTVISTFPSEGIARAAQKATPAFTLNGVDVVRMEFGRPVDLPDKEADVWLIVSIVTANAAKAYGRKTDDLLITADPVRDGEGRIVGCKHFATID